MSDASSQAAWRQAIAKPMGTPLLGALLCSAYLLVPGFPARADQPVGTIENLHYEIAPDYTYRLTIVQDQFVTKQSQVKGASEMSITYDPDRMSVRLLKGWTEGRDGSRYEPAADAIFTRPSAASRQAPGFVSSVTTTIVMPRVETGSHVHYEIEETVSKPALMGFNPIVRQSPFENSDEHVAIDIPSDLPLSIASQGGFVVSDTSANGIRHITADARLRGVSAKDKEPHMVPWEEFEPLFLATSLKNYEEAGAIYHRINRDKAFVTPAIQALATRIVDGRTGIDAARAIYDWDAKNIRYLAVYMDDDAGDESHDAATVLKNGYGDCKDHVTLMQALLAAVGIRSEPVLIDWSDRMKPLPVWSERETNHAVIYLPDFDVFGNPTSPFTPFGVLDQGLSGKLAILAGDHPEIRHTPAVTPDAARFVTQGDIAVAADGTVTGKATATMSPGLEEAVRSLLQDSDENDRRIDRILASSPEGGFGHLTTTDPYDADHSFELTMDWHSPHGVDPSAGAFLLPSPPSFVPVDEPRSFLGRSEKRSTPISLTVRDCVWNYSVTFANGRTIAAAPKNVAVSNELGSYTATYRIDGNKLAVQRNFILKTREIEPSRYPQLEALIYAYENDRSAIVTTVALKADTASRPGRNPTSDSDADMPGDGRGEASRLAG